MDIDRDRAEAAHIIIHYIKKLVHAGMQISSYLVTVPSTCRLLPPTAAAPSKASVVDAAAAANSTSMSASHGQKKVMGRRELAVKTINILAAAGTPGLLLLSPLAMAVSDEYVKETSGVIRMVRTTITMDKTDPNVASTETKLREASNSWVAKYRREKSLLGRTSFRDMYSALNAVSGHYVSFEPTTPLSPLNKRLEFSRGSDTTEKVLLRGR